MEQRARIATRGELYCLSVLLGECFGIIYILGSTVLDVLHLW